MNIAELQESGILLVDKPSEWTSHDVVGCIRRRFKVKKVGHCGTLDPAATGLLVIVLGKATKLSQRLSTQDKVYTGTMLLGVETDSQDADGEVTATHDASGVTPEELRRVAAKFEGEIEQIPPMVSAVKVNGQPLYKLARKGQVIEREPRPATIHKLEFKEINLPEATLEVHCSKGTYIRTLCADIGHELGCGAHLKSLRRLRSGRFSVENAHTIDTIKTWEREQLFENYIPLAELLNFLT
jgi:tRNA pseudouridine55 synthase